MNRATLGYISERWMDPRKDSTMNYSLNESQLLTQQSRMKYEIQLATQITGKEQNKRN